MMEQHPDLGQPDPEQDEPRRPLIEWVFGIVSGALVTVLLVFLAAEALLGTSRRPRLDVLIVALDHDVGQTLVTVELANRGDQTASDVTILAVATGPAQALLQRDLGFDHIAPHASRRGVFAFPALLTANDLRVEIGSFTGP